MQKNKKSNLDRLLQEQQESQHKQRVLESQFARPDWVRRGLVVKVKSNAKERYYKVKGDVVKVHDRDHIVVKMSTDGKEVEFKERDLAKVIPSEGGRVLITILNKEGTVTAIDLKTQVATAKIVNSEGNREYIKVNLDDICKITNN